MDTSGEEKQIHPPSQNDVEYNKDGSNVNTPAQVGESEETARVVDHKAERALCRKFDYRLLPVLALMCKIYKFLNLINSVG
jgi:hypothetical protein